MIVLGWPPRELHPNARPHYMQRAKAAKATREAAYWTAKAANLPRIADGNDVRIDIEFCPPDRRRRDLDGMLSASKSQLDGIADALEINDYSFTLTLRRGEPVKGGKVIASIICGLSTGLPPFLDATAGA